MISLLLLILALMMSAVVTRIGAIALEITGLTPDQALFQASSAFSGTGFTTQEAELAVRLPQRRKIIRNLIRFGNAGIITTMATLVGTLVASPQLVASLDNQIILFGVTFSKPILLLCALIFGVYAVQRFLSKPAVSRLIKEMVTQWLLHEHLVEPVMYEQVAICANGNGIVQLEICEKNPMLNRTLAETGISGRNISVLNVTKAHESVAFPAPDYRIEQGDLLMLFGPLNSIHASCITPETPTHIHNKDLLEDAPLALGTEAPLFSLPDQHGNFFHLADFIGKKHVILLFYPMDNTPTCSSQLKKFASHPDDIAALDAVVVAINPQSVKSHARFGSQINVHYPILTDKNKAVCRRYKAMMLWGLLVNRTVYVIDKSGRISYAQRGNPRLNEVLQAIHTGSGQRPPEPETPACTLSV